MICAVPLCTRKAVVKVIAKPGRYDIGEKKRTVALCERHEPRWRKELEG